MSQSGSYTGASPSMGGNSNNLYPPNIQQNMSLHPPDYDPRRLFPFGLSPIPEVPSELASEVSSIASSPTPSYDDSDTEIESVRSGRSHGHSIMYSGSCDSNKSNNTIHGKSSSESSTETDHESTEEETEDEQEGFAVEEIPKDTVIPITINNSSTKVTENTLYNSEVTQVMHQRTFVSSESPKVSDVQNVEDNATIEDRKIVTPVMIEKSTGDMVSGAATASEIFRHLQATRGKQEVTTELAKILTVLKTTLQTETIDKEEDDSSSDEEPETQEVVVKDPPMPTGKPPRHPHKKSRTLAAISPMIQAKIKELENSKAHNPKAEMNLLSKILVHLLCSCKTVEAAQELKSIIKQFKEVAKVAMEEGDDTLELLRSNSRASSRNTRRKARSRTASGNSNISGNSETDSLNTLTPGDSKSSGTDDEASNDSKLNKIRFTNNLGSKQAEVESCVSYTLTLPLSKDVVAQNNEVVHEEDDEEWEWEYEDELDTSTPTKQGSSGSSRNLTPSEGKSDGSTGSTRKLLTEMEMGAYNSSTSHSSDRGNSQSTPITEEEDILDEDNDNNEKRRRKLSEDEEASGHLFCHLEETFKVLSDTYKIITTGHPSETQQNHDSSQQEVDDEVDEHFENILDGISTQCVQLETEMTRSSRQSTATPEGRSTPTPSQSNKTPSQSRPASRSGSKMSSRPGSRLKTKTPLPNEEDDEDWGDEDGWEYYYEDDCDGSRPPSQQKILSRPVSRQVIKSRPQSRQTDKLPQEYVSAKKVLSRPSSRQESSQNESAKIISRPASQASRPASRSTKLESRTSSRAQSRMKDEGHGDEEEEDWGEEWEYEYYYEEDVDEAGNVTSRPVSRQRIASRQGSVSRCSSRQELISRVSSRQEIQMIPPKNEQHEINDDEDECRSQISRPHSRTITPEQRNYPIPSIESKVIPNKCDEKIDVDENSRPASRTTKIESKPSSRASSRMKSDSNEDEGQEEEDWGDEWEYEYYYEEEVDEAGNVTSRPVSRQRVASRHGGPSRTQSRQEANTRVLSRQEMNRVPSRQNQPAIVSRPSSRTTRPESKAASVNSRPASRTIKLESKPSSRASSRMKPDANTDEGQEEEGGWGDDWEYEYYYEEEVDEKGNVTSRPVSRQKVSSRGPSRASSRQGELQNKPANHNEVLTTAYSAIQTAKKETLVIQNSDVKTKDSSRPNSRQSQTQSRPTSRNSSRPASRTGSRAASRLKRTLGNVEEENEYEWYYDDNDDMELARLSPTLTTAPTTRATSPFPGEEEKAAAEITNSIGTGFSKRRISVIDEEDESTPRPSTVVSKTPTIKGGSVTPKPEDMRSASSKSQTGNRTPSFYNSGDVGYLNPMAGVSVALAAEYLGQDAEQLVASLPAQFIEENQVVKERKKKKHRQKENDDENDQETGGDDDKKKRKKKKKKDKNGKFLPKVGVKELANRLEGELFQDVQCGNKMVISKEEVRDVIRESKKKSKNQELMHDSKPGTPNSGRSPSKEEKRKSVKEMVQLMSTQLPNPKEAVELNDPNNYAGNPPSSYNIPSISVSTTMPPPVPPLPQGYYTSPTPQFPPSQYQPYPIEVRPQYPQQYHDFQQYPPQSPYQQYPQQYPAYQGYPPPPPPQHYQQYPPQQYQQYPPQMQPYPPGYQNYPPQQPIIYQSETPNQVKVVSGGQTTLVNMRNKTTGTRQKEQVLSNKSPEQEDDSEAYGTGSTGSDETENQVAGIDHDETQVDEGQHEGVVPGKPRKRTSRLFKLLQDETDYTDSDTESRSEYSRISMKNVEDNHGKESDIDSVCSGVERTPKGIDRKHSFRSHKSSNKESDNESVTSSGIERKISPSSMQKNLTTRRFMQLNLKSQTEYEPSSSELSTPNSPTAAGAPDDRKKRSSSKPPSRVWNYHADDFDSHAGVSDDSSYQSLQSLNSFDSIHDSNAGREVEEIMKRKVNRDNLYRYQTDSPANYKTASPKSVEMIRNSPKTHSSSPKLDPYNSASPKIEAELLELASFPNSPGISLRQLHSRGYYGGGK